jgi:uncharacterized Zn-binding protein involved in type VI secretion
MKHIADKESAFFVYNVNPDFCRVHGAVKGFDIVQFLSQEKTAYSPNMTSRGARVLRVGSVVEAVKGNNGKGVRSTVARGTGDTIIIEGSDRLFVNGFPVCHDGHEVDMNVKV